MCILVAGYAREATLRPRRAVAIVAVLPLFQAAYGLALGLLVELGVYV